MNTNDIAPLQRSDRWAGALSATADKPPSMRTFGLVMLAGFGVLGTLAIITYEKTGSPWRLWIGVVFLAIAAVIFVWSLVAPASLPPVYRAWMGFGTGIGNVVSTVLLSIVYFIVVTPVGWLMRLTGSDPLARKRDAAAASYWVVRAPRTPREHYQHMS